MKWLTIVATEKKMKEGAGVIQICLYVAASPMAGG